MQHNSHKVLHVMFYEQAHVKYLQDRLLKDFIFHFMTAINLTKTY